MTYDLKICQCPVRIPSRFWAREREPTVFSLASRGNFILLSWRPHRPTMSKAIPKECMALLKSPVKVPKLRTGSDVQSAPTAAMCIVAPRCSAKQVVCLVSVEKRCQLKR